MHLHGLAAENIAAIALLISDFAHLSWGCHAVLDSRSWCAQSSTLMQILMELNTSAIPANISKTVRNNAGGAWNHLSYFKVRSAALCIVKEPLPWSTGAPH